jgi:Copper transport outer membrane protein, MctB
MGYSSRYHAASLAAVFLALAIGILIGVNFGDDVVSGTARSLEESLQSDLNDARAEADELSDELETERDFGEAAYPALVSGRLREDRVGLIGIGGLPASVVEDIEAMLEPTGATLAQVSVVRAPPDSDELAQQLEGTEFDRVDRDPAQLEELGRQLGRQLVSGRGELIDQVREQFLVRESGRGERLDHVIVVRDVPGDLGGDEQEATETMESGLLEGLAEAPQEVVGVEHSDTEESSIALFDSHGIPTSDSIDLVPGRVAAVFVLLGADGNFGTKDSADQLLPDLLIPSGPTR